MLIVVGLSLAAVLSVVIPVGTSNKEPDWLLVTLIPAGLLALAGLYLYFWIVVLELFIKMGPLDYVDSNLYGSPIQSLPPPPVLMYAVPMICGGQGPVFQRTPTDSNHNPIKKEHDKVTITNRIYRPIPVPSLPKQYSQAKMPFSPSYPEAQAIQKHKQCSNFHFKKLNYLDNIKKVGSEVDEETPSGKGKPKSLIEERHYEVDERTQRGHTKLPKSTI